MAADTKLVPVDTKAMSLALGMQETYLHYDRTTEELMVQHTKNIEARHQELTDQMIDLLAAMGIEGSPEEWWLDARYLDQHGHAYLRRRDETEDPEQKLRSMAPVSENIN